MWLTTQQFLYICRSQKIFQNFRDQMQSDIDNWNTQTQNPSGTQLADISQKQVDIDVSSVQATDSEGNRKHVDYIGK